RGAVRQKRVVAGKVSDPATFPPPRREGSFIIGTVREVVEFVDREEALNPIGQATTDQAGVVGEIIDDAAVGPAAVASLERLGVSQWKSVAHGSMPRERSTS